MGGGVSGPGERCNEEYTCTHARTRTQAHAHRDGCSHTSYMVWGTWQVPGPGSMSGWGLGVIPLSGLCESRWGEAGVCA